ncbi:hypothetical protein COV58_02030 [Candidatus Roizmanbacteria bacterium CG11_big_fil_rev_8_21_14_0_20_36_8]|uniref:Alpha/beta hydrolase n=1 Tax=Candidatus Roizmanbacteria bacterium CG11_big_fil_rev_8_21_14_0_20_36_8 TaxID=1974856 RepID=A0A2M6IUR8_9BACT|nr:MAG: hypothetical protein COV58_02030 [Candidatus Roizmanbacteria bacterium CG11_big_fil_rev_8_21_14_0_20_36_8]
MSEFTEAPPLMHRPLSQLGRVEQSGNIPERPIVEKLHLLTRKYGIPEDDITSPKYIDLDEITYPLYDETGMYMIKAMKCDLNPYLYGAELIENDERPLMTFVMFGGGGSTAIDNVHFLLKIAEGIKQYESKQGSEQKKFPVQVRVVLLPHIISTPREIDTKDPAKEKNFSDTARILKKAMEIRELEITKDIGLIGASSGGAQATELAAILQDRCKFLALADAAGMADYPNLIVDFSIGQFVDVFKKFRNKGMSVKDSLQTGLNELYNTTSTRYGNLRNIRDLIRDYTNPVRNRINERAAHAYGMDRTGSKALPIDTLKFDSTKNARENIIAPVIFSPVIYAKVVNTLFERLKLKQVGINTVQDMRVTRDLSSEAREEFDKECMAILKEVFPVVDERNICYTPFESTTHSSFSIQTFWNQLVAEIPKAIS